MSGLCSHPGKEKQGEAGGGLISNGWGEVSQISSAGLPLHPELVPHLVPVSALPRRSQAWALCRRGFFLQRKPRGRREKRSWASKSSGRRWGGRGKAANPKCGLPLEPPRRSTGNSWPGTQKRGHQSKRAGREKSRKPRAVSLPGKNIKRLKIKQRGGRGGLGQPP